jgi:methylase of polypeptide subunit release factors
MRLPPFLGRRAYGLYRQVFVRVRSSRPVHRLLFGQDPLGPFPGPYWDYTTVDLRRALPRFLARGGSFLDMGTGPFAVLGVFAARRLDARVVAVDRIPSVVDSARRHVAAAGVDVDVRESDLFAAVDGAFDVVAFNPPYLASDTARRLGIFRSPDQQERWDGGLQGLDVVAPFLDQARGHLSPGGRVLLGTCHLFVDPAEFRALVDRAGFAVEGTLRFPFGLSTVYVLSRGEPGTGSPRRGTDRRCDPDA